MPEASTPKKQQAKLPPALNPEIPAIVQPYRDLIARGHILKIECVFRGTSMTTEAEVAPYVKVPEGSLRTGLSPFAAKQLIIDSGLWTPGKPGDKSKSTVTGVQLPKRSLVKEDFLGTDVELLKRAEAVAGSLGSQVAVGRIGSLNYMAKGVNTFEKWWAGAPAPYKSRLLMDGKHHSELGEEDHDRLAAVMIKCPFLGAVPTPSEEGPSNGPTKPPSPQKASASGSKLPNGSN